MDNEPIDKGFDLKPKSGSEGEPGRMGLPKKLPNTVGLHTSLHVKVCESGKEIAGDRSATAGEQPTDTQKVVRFQT